MSLFQRIPQEFWVLSFLTSSIESFAARGQQLYQKTILNVRFDCEYCPKLRRKFLRNVVRETSILEPTPVEPDQETARDPRRKSFERAVSTRAPLSITRINAAQQMIRQFRESLLSIIAAKDSADITSNPSIITIYQTVRIQLSRCTARARAREEERMRGGRDEGGREEGTKKKKGDR